MSAVETRNVSRQNFFLLADLTIEGRSDSFRAKVRNLSAGGMMAEGNFDIERGARVVVQLRNIGKVKGTVAWDQGNRLGIAFDSEIDPSLARQAQSDGAKEAPSYARPVLDAAYYEGQAGRVRKI